MSTMHCLVVCGAKAANDDVDAALFGDFMGLARTLRSLNTNISGTAGRILVLWDTCSTHLMQKIMFMRLKRLL